MSVEQYVKDAKALRKLKSRLEEPRYSDVKSFLEAVRSVPQDVDYSRLVNLLTLRPVKENANMVSILQEIGVSVNARDFTAASAVAVRVLEAGVTEVSMTEVPKK